MVTNLEKNDLLQEKSKSAVRGLPGADFVLQKIDSITVEPNEYYDFEKNIKGTRLENISDSEKKMVQMRMNYSSYCISRGDYNELSQFQKYIDGLGLKELGKNYQGLKEIFFHDLQIMNQKILMDKRKREKEQKEISTLKIKQKQDDSRKVSQLKDKLFESDTFMGISVKDIPLGDFIIMDNPKLLETQNDDFDIREFLTDAEKSTLDDKDYATLHLRVKYTISQMQKNEKFSDIMIKLISKLEDSEKNRQLISLYSNICVFSRGLELQKKFPHSFGKMV